VSDLPTLVLPTEEELLRFGWGQENRDRVEEFARPLLTCGHYGEPVFCHSSQWDFPADAHRCPECGEARQWDLRLQAEIMAEWT
jgi:hypothetical protein